jgi:hypothetical protein
MDNIPQLLATDISSMSNMINNALNDWSLQNKGISVVAEGLDEKVMIGFNNTIGPRCLVVFVGEEPRGDLSELEGWVIRHFDISINRGKILSDPRNSGLTKDTQQARSFYSLVAEARDVLRSIILPDGLFYNPIIYNGIRPDPQDKWLMDSYVISISIICNIGRIQTTPPEIAGGQMVELGDLTSLIQNQPPGN